MTSNFSQSSFQNLLLCVYIGNTSSFDDQTLINYCSKFGTILSCSIDNCPDEKRPFCDFRIVEFSTKQQLEHFLSISIHKIGSIILDIKLYKNLLENFELLNIDRKLFIGPILNPTDINTITQFYKIIDRTLQYCLSRQEQQTYILIEFSNRQYIRTIIQQQTIPKTIDNQILTIHTAVHPKELINKKISTTNNQYQICIQGLTDKITETMLIDYFDKRASVIACHILSMDPKCAIIEFENEKCAQKFLDIPFIRLHGTNLTCSKVPNHFTSSAMDDNNNEENYNNDEIDQLLETTGPKSVTSSLHSLPRRNEPFLAIPSPVQHVAIQSNSISYCQTPSMITESIPSPDINQCGWTSPPRTITSHCLPVDQPPERLSSIPCSTTTDMNIDSTYQSIVIETDTKSIKNVTKNLLQFVEQFQKELERIKDEYMMKFTRDRTSIEHELNRLMNDERIAFDKIDRYLYEHRPHSTKSYDNRRNHS